MFLTSMTRSSPMWRSILPWTNLSIHQEQIQDSIIHTKTTLQEIKALHLLQILEKFITTVQQRPMCLRSYHLLKVLLRMQDIFLWFLEIAPPSPLCHKYRQMIRGHLRFLLSLRLLRLHHPHVVCLTMYYTPSHLHRAIRRLFLAKHRVRMLHSHPQCHYPHRTRQRSDHLYRADHCHL